MKKKLLLSLCAVCILVSGCGEKEKTDPASSTPPPAETSTESPKEASTSPEIPKENTPVKISTENWIRDADFSANKLHHFPWLNEDILGITAIEFNAKIKEVYKDISYILEEGAYAQAYSESTNYQTFTDAETNVFSVIFQFPFGRRSRGYRSLTLDLSTRKKISFQEFTSRYELRPEDVRESVERYHESIYSTSAEDFGYEELKDFEEYMKGRLASYDAQAEEKPNPFDGNVYPLYYGLSDGKPSVYVVSEYPLEGDAYMNETFQIRLRKNLADFAFSNATENSAGTLIQYPSDEDIKYAKPLRTIETENASPEETFLLIATRDDVRVEINALSFDETEAETKIGDSYYSGTLQKGQSLLIQAILPEGIPYVMMTLSYSQKIQDVEYIFRTKKTFYFNGAFGNPKIEYLEGRLDS